MRRVSTRHEARIDHYLVEVRYRRGVVDLYELDGELRPGEVFRHVRAAVGKAAGVHVLREPLCKPSDTGPFATRMRDLWEQRVKAAAGEHDHYTPGRARAYAREALDHDAAALPRLSTSEDGDA